MEPEINRLPKNKAEYYRIRLLQKQQHWEGRYVKVEYKRDVKPLYIQIYKGKT